MRAELVERKHPELSIRKQCELLHVTRSVFYYKPMEQSESDRKIIRVPIGRRSEGSELIIDLLVCKASNTSE